MHLSPDTLALLALGEAAASPSETAHLAACGSCTATLSELRDAVRVGRSTIDIGPLAQPSPAVWDRIAAELDLPGGRADPVAPAVRRPRLRRRRWMWAVAAGVLIVAGVAGLTVRALVTAAEPRIEAAAALHAFPSWAGSSGSAVVELQQDGVRTVTVHVHVDGPATGTHEVWLMTGDLKALVALGNLHGDSGVFTVPARIDLGRYDVVDVSDEPNDGNPGHSGNSIVRGGLRDS